MKRKDTHARLNLVIHQRVREQVERLRDRMGADTLSEAVRRAVGMVEMITDHVRGGGVIVLRDRDGAERELLLMGVPTE